MRVAGALVLATLLVARAVAAGDPAGGGLRLEILEPEDGLVLTGTSAEVRVKGRASLQDVSAQLDLVLVVDGSMSLAESDPYELRLKSAEEFVYSFPPGPGIRTGVVGFDRTAELVVAPTSNRKAVVDGLRSLGRRGFTDIGEGIRAGLDALAQHGRPGAARAMIVFTDGRGGETKTRRAAEEARARGTAIHSVLLGSDERGHALLREISAETGGTSTRVESPEDPSAVFAGLVTARLRDVTLRVGEGPAVTASLDAGIFQAPIDLAIGVNHIVATVSSDEGRSLSDDVTVVLRPPGCAELEVDASPEVALALGPRSVALVLDSSGSMWGPMDGRTKMQIARKTLLEIVSRTPAQVELSLRAYGHQHPREARNCEDTRLLVPRARGNRRELVEAISRIEPRGQTPIGYTLRQVAKDLAGGEGERAVVLLTDGIESCAGDAAEEARALRSELGAPVHVIGFGLPSDTDADATGLRSIAEASGGLFVRADDGGELVRALSRTVGTTYRVLHAGRPVARGVMGSGEPVRLQPGDYLVQLETSPSISASVAVESGSKHHLSFALDSGKVVGSARREASGGSSTCPLQTTHE